MVAADRFTIPWGVTLGDRNFLEVLLFNSTPAGTINFSIEMSLF
ncbi:MAG: hypothetical protein RMX96_15740 [Nostoc sp. ChiSLP02]|nr:hypothetical protein [Nostoc sp. DedSLP05]MDZ8098517.1 hypothetical protein [Nostoc sp. DedSLP01]MDZ8186290.1 hypothetical protein [Nostoc sp. ChiSLP02]